MKLLETKNDKGFSLVEVLVSMVVVSLLLICLVSAFRATRQLNSVASKRDQAINIASSLMEKLKGTEYETIADNESNVYNLLADNVFEPFNFDTASIVKESALNPTYTISGIEGNLSNYKVTLELFPDNYSDENNVKFPAFESLNEDDTVILDTYGMNLVFNKNGDDYIREDDGYKYSYSDTDSWDNLALMEFGDRNKAYIDKIYQEKCDEIDDYNEAHADSGIILEYPEFGIDPYRYKTDDELKAIIDKEFSIDIEGHTNYAVISVKIDYIMKDDIAPTVIGEDIDNIVTYDIVRSSTYEKIENVYFLYDESFYDSDTIKVNNGVGDSNDSSIPFNLFVLVQNEYNKDAVKSIMDLRSDIYKKATANKLTFKYNQVSPVANLLTLYTNCDKVTVVSPIVTRIDTNYAYRQAEARTRYYGVKITVTDGSDTFLYSTVESGILK